MIVVDAINTIHAHSFLKSLASVNINEALVQVAHLVRGAYKSGRIKLVVDGFPKPLHGLPADCAVQFSRDGEADDVIVRIINKGHNQRFTLISGDRGLVRRLTGSVKVVQPSTLSSKSKSAANFKKSKAKHISTDPSVSELEVQEMLRLFNEDDESNA